MNRRPSKKVRAQHGRNVQVAGGRGAYGARILIEHRRGYPITHSRDQSWVSAFVARGALRDLRDCIDRILDDRKPRARRFR